MNAQSSNFDSFKIPNEMSDSAFNKVSEFAFAHAGIVLGNSKRSMVTSRLTRRLRALKIQSFDEYLDFVLTSENERENSLMISALTTNVSHFFREKHHFEYLISSIVPKIKAKIALNQSIRIWSAGCSNGQEPYSIAMSLLPALPEIENSDVKILATDIDAEVLTRAQSGTFPKSLTSGLDDEKMNLFFDTKPGTDEIFIKKSVKNLITFKQLNLHDSWPMRGKFDVIFCRNVLIYFDEATQQSLFEKFSSYLTNSGTLFLGHSERLIGAAKSNFKNTGVTTYSKFDSTSDLKKLHPQETTFKE